MLYLGERSMVAQPKPANDQSGRRRGVLFLCTGNSARSQMAEAFLRKHSQGRFAVYSAGIRPRGLHPLTTTVMAEIGVDVSQQQSKGLDAIADVGSIFFVISLCENAERECPDTFAPASVRLSWPLDDPTKADSTEQMLPKFRRARDEIDLRIQEWLRNELPPSWLK